MMSRPKSNVELLTEGAKYIQRAKKARREQIEEIKFDDEARREWLTGFSKRKKAKAEEKKVRAKERDHQAHLKERREARAELRKKAAENVKSVRRAMGLEDISDYESEDDEKDNQAGPSRTKAVEEEEYSDEENLATVTIEEDFDPSSVSLKDSRRFANSNSQSPGPDAHGEERQSEIKEMEKQRPKVKMLPPSSAKLQKIREKKKEEKKKSTSMETAAERRKGRIFEAQRRTKKASLARDREGGSKRGGKGGTRGKGRGGKSRR
ncbi:uncharacterized protein I303_103533 [Kwoniella dejecticola CBS 10117]|uniref:Ribosomal RNA-processing protein 17 n=1 Tax=Kwoniella dejecticola CBS 10117 TaxID=1296121 RepID=A0A1A6A715_9TREE|nr:ribosomal RNA-processing protein 17 [Kwoniella dejecticola CBS 10117]OBR85843.1 ribosomal RNA-processing protein 17 [Kwoniella dejecticola CBS 10117]